ncbi:MAG: sarcosine oxidase subunit delta [Pseudomonadota bacterium]
MMRIACPFCGPRDHDEFSYEGDASVHHPPLDAPREAWCEAIFMRENRRGVVQELWQHVHGCRCWLVIERDTGTHEILTVRYATPGIEAAMAGEAGEPSPRKERVAQPGKERVALPGEAAE